MSSQVSIAALRRKIEKHRQDVAQYGNPQIAESWSRLEDHLQTIFRKEGE